MILLVFLLETNDFLYSSVLLVFIIFFSDICCDWHTLRVVGIIRLLLVSYSWLVEMRRDLNTCRVNHAG